MPRPRPLPLPEEWTDPDAYVDALLSFTTSSELFIHVCGGVHILDFLTREPDLYDSLLPLDWRTFFEKHDIQDILDLLLREDIPSLLQQSRRFSESDPSRDAEASWRGQPLPPIDLLEYIHQIRRLSLGRDFTSRQPGKVSLPHHLSVGMNQKKYHEVAHFSRYVNDLCDTVAEERGEAISHIVDFGSGQNYLGRTLASPPYNKHIIAIERKHQFISGAKGMDIHAKLAKKQKRIVYKTSGRRSRKGLENDQDTTPSTPEVELVENIPIDASTKPGAGDGEDSTVFNVLLDIDIQPDEWGTSPYKNGPPKKSVGKNEDELPLKGTMDYIEHEIKDGYLEPIIKDVIRSRCLETKGSQGPAVDRDSRPEGKAEDPNVMVISLHSCGNLLHHGIRSLVLNPSVKAIAMIGCCYNLVTERLGPATYKVPILRTQHPRLTQDACAYDPHGFPMSKRLESYEHISGTGVKLNITARSMSLQAPYNWGREDSEAFFTRHFYRALLQRIFVDRGVVEKPVNPTDLYGLETGGPDAVGNPLIVGSLRKAAFTSFSAYVHAAVAKLSKDPHNGEKVKARMAGITEEEVKRYEVEYWPRKKHLSVTWALMAFSSALVEALIVVDRWQFLREHDTVRDCWVEPVFEYSESPRNLAVVGIKK
ncbi:hypothetical protein KXX57_007453 [Aspergillus fumigatus]|uniref:Methyltransferase domain-containing protein n=2 Tax=Aspergillus fumigatus TaxID=746128 RepID=Q4WEG1_ASPFU|nr:conserved hypothetical protein [Aspergillus fumigatus Af293]KAH1425350.1 hypothetical protein KXX32_006574 [Aspergillus fumigatus]EAL86016.1 conserved hypothetical protein [Aspergillus fumigatus Af293]KAH1552723.1 hypothetical protein KXX57_007453 [Aspergillus fumigatus]KAH1905313.1 hypothetical protein KXV57_006090 [Aspergillus fumigatus]KAH2280479.1 hypothetical protein KXW02_005985 [Aspergillus fumigatus]